MIPTAGKLSIWYKLVSIIRDIGMRIKDLRELLLGFNFRIQKFLKLRESSEDWHKSRYAPVISTLKVAKYDIEQETDKGLNIINELGHLSVALNGADKHCSVSGQVDLEEQHNYHELRSRFQSENPRYIKQRSAEWFDKSKEYVVTGSTCNKALGLGKLKQQQAHFSKVILGLDEDNATYSDDVRRNMEYGTKHEIDGVATMVSRIIPVLFPTLDYYEEGCARMALNENSSFFVVSPDGICCAGSDETPQFMYENKCKVKNPFATDA